ncbi:TetR family transcriptional regulator [Paractinoplanes deccanensis]|uniref:TetR family transcriptional regulator n=1 Tax=Paractinoplanes deccanensis TaxID=113561 RepID=A0ABQ3YAB4_9ACTN|nr:TetR/AcrR family transcriptional regulator [Actinoplanes deccanensis]GID76891.1 TetR family transcriptional regulator [Actinoplanes deccanensis]
MARWEPNARERLASSALDLFAERGYEGTTAAEIAARAGLAKSTFFRHFADKREVLFAGQDLIGEAFAAAMRACPPSATPRELLHAALAAAAFAFGDERRAWVVRRQAVIDDNTELRERELLKRASLTAALESALRERGLGERLAALAAEVGSLAFRGAFARWIAPSNARGYAELAREELDALASAAASLG